MANQMEAMLAANLLKAAQQVEEQVGALPHERAYVRHVCEQVDQEIERLETIDDDEMEKIRHNRMAQMKKAARQKEASSKLPFYDTIDMCIN